MNSLRRPRYLLAGFGLVLLLAGALSAYWWHYRQAPMRRLADPDWLAAHSEQERWREEQRDYRRAGNSPDLCFRGDRIGYYGDKDWFLWLEERIRDPESFRHCGCTETALALMANQHATSWPAWIATNRNRAQEEWIRDGFRAHGVMVQLPPAPGDTVPLLRLLGRRTWNVLWGGPQGTNAPWAVPSHVQYNAFRWLRDSGFDPSGFLASNATLIADSNVVRGLRQFSEWRAQFPGDGGLGVLAFGRRPQGPRWHKAARPWEAIGVNLGIGICLLAGGGLWWRARSPNSRKPAPAAA